MSVRAGQEQEALKRIRASGTEMGLHLVFFPYTTSFHFKRNTLRMEDSFGPLLGAWLRIGEVMPELTLQKLVIIGSSSKHSRVINTDR